VRVPTLVGCGAAVALLAASAGVTALFGSEPRVCPDPATQQATSRSGAAHAGSAHDAHHTTSGHGGGGAGLMTGPTCNVLEMVAPPESTYVPDLAHASAADRRTAQRLLDGVNEFCDSHPVEALTETWLPGSSSPPGATHRFNPDRDSRGLDPANPRAALVYDGELGGVMFVGRPLPSLGSIPRAHQHDEDKPSEMLHVYCTRNLRDAFTPSRMLGVKADLPPLRLWIRPAVMDLDESELRAVLARVRGDAGDDLAPFTPLEQQADGGPDPVLQAMRTEIRRSLMLLDEPQLRSLRSLLRSY
jgi:hypothetical protein